MSGGVVSGLGSLSRLQAWARSIAVAGLRSVSKMASPPTVTLPVSTVSALNASNNAAGLPDAGKYPNLNLAGYLTTTVSTSNPNNNSIQFNGPALTDGSTGGVTLARARFTTIAPAFEVCFAEVTGCKINALVDEGDGPKFVGLYDGTVPNALQSGGTRYMQYNFGSDVLSYGIATVGIGSGGAGYAVGNVLTLSGGTFTRPATFTARAVDGGGAVTLLTMQDPGEYTVLPAFPAATTGGAGAGLTIGSAGRFPIHSVAKPRKIELLIEGARLYGINYPTWAGGEAVITPYKFDPMNPKLYWLGDSQDANTYAVFAGAEVGFIAAQRLRMAENITIDAQGGTGFNVNNGLAPAFEHANRVNAVISANPDVVVFPYSQNVGANTQATSQAAALSFVTQLQAALPNTLFVMIGPAYGFQSWHLSAMQYVMANAPAPSRIRMVDTITEGWATGGSSGFLTTDNTHWGTWGNFNWRSVLLAEAIKNSILDMML